MDFDPRGHGLNAEKNDEMCIITMGKVTHQPFTVVCIYIYLHDMVPKNLDNMRNTKWQPHRQCRDSGRSQVGLSAGTWLWRGSVGPWWAQGSVGQAMSDTICGKIVDLQASCSRTQAGANIISHNMKGTKISRARVWVEGWWCRDSWDGYL